MEKEKKVILALKGYKERGKTTTLRKLSLKLLELIGEKEDIQVIFHYEGMKIAISTGGDDKGVFKEDTAFCKENKPDILVTPTRTKEIRRIIDLIKKNEENSTLLDKLSQELQDSDSATALRKLSREFLKLIEEKEDIQIAFCYRGKKIAISTAGDDESVVKGSIAFFEALEADILITATRTGKRTKGPLIKHASPDANRFNVTLYWENKVYVASDLEKEQINEAQAKKLHAFIDLIIDNWDSEPKK